MLEQAIATNPHFALSLVDVQRTGPSYTVETLRFLRHEWGSRTEFYFVIGGDSLKDLPDWYDPAGILAQATIVALMRPGYTDVTTERELLIARLPGLQQRLIMLEGPLMELSSTELRQRVAKGRPIKYQTPEVVEQYIFRHHLYQEAGQRREQGQEDIHAPNAI
jgi:nicotinate-nucleotide adenylyltransferase